MRKDKRTLLKAQRIASDWHGGQNTVLYAFASTGNFELYKGEGLARFIGECNLITDDKDREYLKQYAVLCNKPISDKPVYPRDWNTTENQSIKGKFVDREVYCNVNNLVEFVLAASYHLSWNEQKDLNIPFTADDIENYYNNVCPECGSNDLLQADEDSDFYICQSCGTETDSPNNEAQEVFEWWSVSEFLYRKLQDKGYPVVDAGSCYLWGRTTTGQAILLDGVISRICEEMEILEGQTNDWSK